MDLNREYTYDVEGRLKWVVWIIAAFFILVGLRLFYLQIVKGDYYRIFSENNSIKDIAIPAARGIIYDKNGEIIVDSRPIFDLAVIPQYISSEGELTETLVQVLGLDRSEMQKLLRDASKEVPYRPYVMAEDVGMDVVSKLKARRLPMEAETDYNIDGLEIRCRYVRDYVDGDIAPHLLGYVREVDQKRLDRLGAASRGKYRRGDYVGINGIEEAYDSFVRGEKGMIQKIVDALGREVGYSDISFEMIDQAAVGGGDPHLTLDLALQRAARDALKGQRGAVVALDPKDGAVLAMVSSPGFDLNSLGSKDRNNYWGSLILDPDRPLFNRAVSGTYPPASTYKIVTAIAALEEGVVIPSEKIACHGGLRFGNRVFGCWKSGGHGPVNIIEALARSCDVYFYTMGLRLGVDKLAEYAKKLGLGSKTGIELPGEKGGLIPTSAWKKEMRGAEWQNSETLSIAIGQGYNLVTPLQMALVGAEVANGGKKLMPYIVRQIVGSDGKVLYEWLGRPRRVKGISDETLEIVRRGLIGVVEDEGGTAGRLKWMDLKIAGKTGTAQVVGKESGMNLKDHAWFVGYAPYDDPKIVVAVVVEHGGHGSSAAAPVAGEVMKEYLKPEVKIVRRQTSDTRPQTFER